MSVLLLTGKNTFALGRALQARLTSYLDLYPGTQPERISASELSAEALNDILNGSTLFSSERIVVLRDPSENKLIWEKLETMIDDVPDDTHLIVVDPSVNKSTRLYKKLIADKLVENFDIVGPSSEQRLIEWIQTEGRAQGLDLQSDAARMLVRKIGYDQWALHYGIQKLASVEDCSLHSIERLIESSLSANVLELFEIALKSDSDTLKQRIEILRLTENPHMVMGLLSSQAVTLALAVYSSRASVELAKLSSTKNKNPSPYPYNQMRKLGVGTRRALVTIKALAECDYDMKHVQADPWLLIERALFKVAE